MHQACKLRCRLPIKTSVGLGESCCSVRRWLSDIAAPTCPPGPQHRIRAAYYRGGTSRGLILRKGDLPEDTRAWGPILAGILGSPDPNGRQLDGMGTGLSSLSKICVVDKSDRPDADIDFTFCQVGIRDGSLDYSSNCGNMSAAVGPFAYDSRLVTKQVHPGDGIAEVTIFNTNTNKLIRSRFPVLADEALVDGPLSIDGVAGTGAKIELAFLDPWGSVTGRLLPTGQIIDNFNGIRVTCIDVGNPCVFVSSADLDLDGTILPSEAERHATLFSTLEQLRRRAGVAMGIADRPASVPEAIPKMIMVSPASRYKTLSNQNLAPEATDIVVRSLSGTGFHRALQITAACATAAAASLKGSIVFENVSPSKANSDGITLGHPSGTLLVKATKDEQGLITEATVYRTARRIMDGFVYWRSLNTIRA